MDQPTNPQSSTQAQTPKTPWQQWLAEATTLLGKSKEVAVIIRANPSLDTIAAGLALTLALEKTGRKAWIVSPEPINEQLISSKSVSTDAITVTDLDQILPFLPNKQLTLTIHYTDGSYVGGELQKSPAGLGFLLKAEPNSAPIEPQKIQTVLTQSVVDAIITLEVDNLASLGQFYLTHQEVFKRGPVINLDYHANNAKYGTVNILDTKATSISEIVALFLWDLRIALDESIAQKLKAGIMSKTDNANPSYHTANMLEALTVCHRYIPKK